MCISFYLSQSFLAKNANKKFFFFICRVWRYRHWLAHENTDVILCDHRFVCWVLCRFEGIRYWLGLWIQLVTTRCSVLLFLITWSKNFSGRSFIFLRQNGYCCISWTTFLLLIFFCQLSFIIWRKNQISKALVQLSYCSVNVQVSEI